jgi:hypothetical protein
VADIVNKVMRESALESALRLRVKELGGKCYKWTSPGNRFVPDDIVCMPIGRLWFVEVKTNGGKLSPGQIRCHAELRSLGFRVEVLWDLIDLNSFLCSL